MNKSGTKHGYILTGFLLFGLLLLLFSHPSLYGEEQEKGMGMFDEYPQALGIFYGEIGGTGLSYHRWSEGKGMQITAGVLYLPPGSIDTWLNDNMLDYVVGFQRQYVVYSEDFAGWLSGLLNLFWGINHRGVIPVSQEWDESTSESTEEIGTYTPSISLGAGIGTEVLLFRHFSFPLEFGYGLNFYPTEADPLKMFNVNLRVQGGFRYRY